MARYVTVTFHLQGAITVTSNILRNSNIHSCPNLAVLQTKVLEGHLYVQARLSQHHSL